MFCVPQKNAFCQENLQLKLHAIRNIETKGDKLKLNE